MALITRLSRLFRADLHALLDRLEEPDILLAQSLREMADAVAADERVLAALRRQRQELLERRDTLTRRGADDADRLEICLDAGQDDLARDLLRRHLERERLLERLGHRGQALDADIATLTTALEQRHRRLEQLRAEAALVADDTPPRTTGDAAAWSGLDADTPPPVRDADVAVALLAAKRRRPA
jgi:phage shock protein A